MLLGDGRMVRLGEVGVEAVGLEGRELGRHREVGQMEEADDALLGDLIDVADLDLDVILGADSDPLTRCIRRLIALNSREGSAIAGFDAFVGGEPTDGT